MATTISRETSSPEETEAAGEQLGQRLRRGDLVLLKGELGAGKTTFVRGMARGTGSPARVASPTFQLVRIYPGRMQLAHVDLYRLEVDDEVRDVGLDELLDTGAVVVEWGDRLATSQLLGRSESALISIDHLGGDRRRLTVERDLSR